MSIAFQGDLSESDYHGTSAIARIETQANGGVEIIIEEEDEFGNTSTAKVVLDPDDIAIINRVKR